MKAGSRLDERVVADGLAETRSKAEGMIRAGQILVDDAPIDKPGTRVRPEAVVRLRAGIGRFVSRGGEKLMGALEDLGVPVAGRHCLDVGASTGGFTECLLLAGALSVVAVDVGYGQLHPKLRDDSRVSVFERTNVRYLEPEALAREGRDPIDLVTLDVSFISARTVLPVLARLLPGAELLVLVKPQFEVGKGRVGKGGVVRDADLRREVVNQVRETAARLGYECRGEAPSRLAGPKGNREVFLWLSPQITDNKGETGRSS